MHCYETREDDSPGTPLGRLKAISEFAEKRLGHSPYSSKAAEIVVLEVLDQLLRERDAGASITFSSPAPDIG